MNLHDILIVIQGITIGMLFVEIWIVFLGWKNQIHSYLFLACAATFISNIGYYLELKATNEETYLTALKLSYVGRAWISFALFLFAAKMCRIKIPKWVVAILALMITGIYISILMIGTNNAYYASYEFVPDPLFPRFDHQNGYAHDLLMGMNALFAVLGIWWLIREYRGEKVRKAKQRYLCLVLSFGVQIIALLLQLSKIFNISRYYDLTMTGALFGTVFLLIGIFGFDLLGTKEIARDFVIDRISEGIIAVDNNGRIQYYNDPVIKIYPQFEQFFGKRDFAAGIRGKKALERKNTDVLENILTPYDIVDRISKAALSNETIKVGDRIYTPEENELSFMGENYGKLYALTDDTEHYRYMEELQKQRDRADSASEAKSLFLASMSHEIRTPINAVLGMDEMILRETDDKNIRAYAANIMSAGRTLLSLINDILDLSKVEEGKMDIIPVRYDLSSLINDLVNVIRIRAEKKGLKLNVIVEEQIPNLLIGDEIRIRQCAMNLLTNAIKYTETGEVSLRVSHKKTDEKHICLHFEVEDTGIGMREEDMDNLFSPYKRIEEKRNRTVEGTGLGMSITRQLLSLMGSELDVKSEYGKGSRFSFEIVQEVAKWDKIGDISARLNDRSEGVHVYHELFHAPDARILVVDDTQMNLTVIEGLLKMTQIKIDTAMSGKDAVRLAADTAYDLLFIDHMMPDMDGIETLKEIRRSGMSKRTPAVALTANAVSGARDMYISAGFTDYLSKPVDGEKIERILFDMLPPDKCEVVCDDERENRDKERSAAEGETVLPERLREMEGIDWKSGLKNCGSMDGYISVLSVFHQTAAAKADEIMDLYKGGDLENYTIKVHALKSSARIIGATNISILAEKLEDAGKSKDTEFIDSNTDKLIDMYRMLDADLSWLDNTDEELREIGEEEIKEAYQTIIEIAGSYDYELMDDILKSLHGYRLSEADGKRVANIERLLAVLDWEGIIREAKEAG